MNQGLIVGGQFGVIFQWVNPTLLHGGHGWGESSPCTIRRQWRQITKNLLRGHTYCLPSASNSWRWRVKGKWGTTGWLAFWVHPGSCTMLSQWSDTPHKPHQGHANPSCLARMPPKVTRIGCAEDILSNDNTTLQRAKNQHLNSLSFSTGLTSRVQFYTLL